MDKEDESMVAIGKIYYQYEDALSILFGTLLCAEEDQRQCLQNRHFRLVEEEQSG